MDKAKTLEKLQSLSGSDEYYSEIQALSSDSKHKEQIFEFAKSLCQDKSVTNRQIGTDLLESFGVYDSQGKFSRFFPAETLHLLFHLLNTEQVPSIIATIVATLGKLCSILEDLGYPEALEAVIKYQQSPEWNIRLAATVAICNYKYREENTAIEAVIKQLEDKREDIRLIAIQHLSELMDYNFEHYIDSTLIRNALWEQYRKDTSLLIRAKAIKGLTLRKDSDATAPLLQEINNLTQKATLTMEEENALLDMLYGIQMIANSSFSELLIGIQRKYRNFDNVEFFQELLTRCSS